MAARGRAHGNDQLRLTPRRRAVLDAVRQSGGHLTAAEIYAVVRRDRPRLACATVYNALNALVERGVLLQLHVGEGASRYDARTDRHDHVLCVTCGALVDVRASRLTRAASRAAAEVGYTVERQHIQYYGRCPSCLDNRHGTSEQALE